MPSAAEHLLACKIQLYRAPNFPGGNGAHDRMRPDESFTSEPAADKRRDDVNALFGNTQRLRYGVACAHHPLRGLPKREVFAVPRRHGSGRLHRVVVLIRSEVFGFMLDRGALERPGRVAALGFQFLAEEL